MGIGKDLVNSLENFSKGLKICAFNLLYITYKDAALFFGRCSSQKKRRFSRANPVSMLKRIFRSGWFCTKAYLPVVAAALMMAPSPSALADNAISTGEGLSTLLSSQTLTAEPYPQISNILNLGLGMVDSEQLDIGFRNDVGKDKPLTEVLDVTPDINQQTVQSDPLNSPHPVPWNWVLATHAEVSANGGSGIRYYRTPSLVSPDGEYAAYSRIEMQVEPELYRSRVSSIMFLENLKTGELRTITASSPLASHPFFRNEEANMPGTIAIAIPVSWSHTGDRILGRQFEGLFSTSDASDYAVVWDRQLNRTATLSPSESEYTTAVLLGWSQTHPNQVLFRTGNLGDENWPLLAVDSEGHTMAAAQDEPSIFGQVVNYIWAGPQAQLK